MNPKLKLYFLIFPLEILFACILGCLSWFIYEILYLIGIFDLLIGLVIYKSVLLLIKKYCIFTRKNVYAICLSCSFAVLIGYNIVDFYTFKNDIYSEIIKVDTTYDSELIDEIYESSFPKNIFSYLLYRSKNEKLIIQELNFSSAKDSIKTAISLASGKSIETDNTPIVNFSLWAIQILIIFTTSSLLCRRYLTNLTEKIYNNDEIRFGHSPLIYIAIVFFTTIILFFLYWSFIENPFGFEFYFLTPIPIVFSYVIFKCIRYLYWAHVKKYPLLRLTYEVIEDNLNNVKIDWNDVEYIHYKISNWNGAITIGVNEKDKIRKKTIPILIIDEDKKKLLSSFMFFCEHNNHKLVDLFVE